SEFPACIWRSERKYRTLLILRFQVPCLRLAFAWDLPNAKRKQGRFINLRIKKRKPIALQFRPRRQRNRSASNTGRRRQFLNKGLDGQDLGLQRLQSAGQGHFIGQTEFHAERSSHLDFEFAWRRWGKGSQEWIVGTFGSVLRWRRQRKWAGA